MLFRSELRSWLHTDFPRSSMLTRSLSCIRGRLRKPAPIRNFSPRTDCTGNCTICSLWKRSSSIFVTTVYMSAPGSMNIRAAALNTPVSVMETAGEGGAWGMALLASYMVHKKDGETYVETECSHLLLGERYPLIISESPPTPSQASVSQPLF